MLAEEVKDVSIDCPMQSHAMNEQKAYAQMPSPARAGETLSSPLGSVPDDFAPTVSQPRLLALLDGLPFDPDEDPHPATDELERLHHEYAALDFADCVQMRRQLE